VTDAAAVTDDTGPCVGCGLCCDGTLYDRAKVAPGEEPTLEALGLQLETVGERTYFLQPCRFQSCGRCTNYADRWTICRSFRCALLRRYQAGEIGLEEARATVKTALQLRDAVRQNDPGAAIVGGRRRLRRQLAEEVQSGKDQGSAGRRLIDIIALDTFLERWFRNKKPQPAGETTAGGDA
jgi:Fe-S-cluster containining protein